MRDLSALTPPLLVGAVVIIAIVAFLRREMGRSRANPPDDDHGAGLAAGEKKTDDVDSKPHGEADVSAGDADDSQSRP